MNIKNLDRPDWFVLIEQWVARGMGQTGITLAFLSGALAFKRGATSSSEAELRKVLADLIETPVDGYVTEIRWCHNIDAPVLSVSREHEALPFESSASNQYGRVSLGFSQDVQSSIGGLDCTCADTCLERLVEYSALHSSQGNFSRVRDPAGSGFCFGKITPAEIEFIKSTIM